MGKLSARNIDDDLIAKLKRRAKANERSMEGELRVVLREVLDGPSSVGAGGFDWDAYIRRAREIAGPAGTKATAVDDIRAWRDGKR